MNIVDFLYQDLNSTKNYVKMLQASLYTINDFSLWFIFIIGVVGQLLIVLSGQIKKYIKIIK